MFLGFPVEAFRRIGDITAGCFLRYYIQKDQIQVTMQERYWPIKATDKGNNFDALGYQPAFVECAL